MNTGFQGKNYEVFAYNGGLFKPDEVLDGLKISDELLRDYCKKLSDYEKEMYLGMDQFFYLNPEKIDVSKIFH